MAKIPCTIGILALNSMRGLPRAIESVKDFAEVIIADGGSTDGTKEYALEHGVKVIAQSHPGERISDFSQERNLTLDAATQPWFFHLDTDELMSVELRDAIRRIAEDTNPAAPEAYRVRYLKTNEEATKVYHTFREYYQIRLFRTTIGARYERPVHERIKLPVETKIVQIEEPWYVPLDSADLSLPIFAKGAWKRTGIQAATWSPAGLKDMLNRIVIFPTVSILKSLVKVIGVKIRWGKDAIPTKYELLRILYSFFVSVRHLMRLFEWLFFARRRSAGHT